MPTFPLGHSAYLTRARNAKTIAAARPPAATIHIHARFEFPNPQDLRGIPVVGGVTGTCPGTDPLLAVLAEESRRERHAA